jgi:hypothetical protein
LIIGSNAVQAAITWVDAHVRPKFTAGLPFVDLGTCFSLFLTSRRTGKPLNGLPRGIHPKMTTRKMPPVVPAATRPAHGLIRCFLAPFQVFLGDIIILSRVILKRRTLGAPGTRQRSWGKGREGSAFVLFTADLAQSPFAHLSDVHCSLSTVPARQQLKVRLELYP